MASQSRRLALVFIALLSIAALPVAAAGCGGGSGGAASSAPSEPVASSAPSEPPATQASSAPAGSTTPDGTALLQDRCTRCHDLARVQSARKSAADWTTTVDRMVGKGASLTDAEKQTLIDYLAATYGG